MTDRRPVEAEYGKIQNIFPRTLEELSRKKYNICSFIVKAGCYLDGFDTRFLFDLVFQFMSQNAQRTKNIMPENYLKS